MGDGEHCGARTRHLGQPRIDQGVVAAVTGVLEAFRQRAAETGAAIGIERGEKAFAAHAHEAGCERGAVVIQADLGERGEFDLQGQHLAVHEDPVTIEDDCLRH